MLSVGTPLLWSLFTLFVVAALAVDFLVLNRGGQRAVSIRAAAIWSLVWVAVSLVFVGWLWWYLGGTGNDPAARTLADTKALEVVTGYLVAKPRAEGNREVYLQRITARACYPR